MMLRLALRSPWNQLKAKREEEKDGAKGSTVKRELPTSEEVDVRQPAGVVHHPPCLMWMIHEALPTPFCDVRRRQPAGRQDGGLGRSKDDQSVIASQPASEPCSSTW